MKGERIVQKPSLGSMVRKRLSDITNSMPPPKSPAPCENADSSTKDYIDSLLKENLGMLQLLADKNKIIELSGIELRKLRLSLQKMQLQNWNLAQANSLMQAELNLGKDKLKELRHELACKNALLKSKNLELEGHHKKNCQNNGPLEEDEEITKNQSTKDDKACNGNRRRPLRSQSMGPPTTSNQIAGKETVENKRRCLRRQSARFQSCKQEQPTEELFELKDLKLSASTPLESPMHEDRVNVVGSSLSNRKTEKDENCAPRGDPRETPRCSFGRPPRKAAVKVQSYKEVPLNIKMRRAE